MHRAQTVPVVASAERAEEGIAAIVAATVPAVASVAVTGRLNNFRQDIPERVA